MDSTDGTANNRIKLFVNGTEVSYATRSMPDQNQDFIISKVATHQFGNHYSGTGSHFDGGIADVHFIDGLALAPTAFAETDDNDQWVPIAYTGAYGDHGYRLEFRQTGTSQNAAGIGADTSGNGNHFAVNSLAALDVVADTPTNNFANLVPVNNISLSEGNTKVVTTRQGYWDAVHSSIGVTSGKWYFEVKASLSDDTFRVAAGVAGDPEQFTILFNGLGATGDPLSTLSATYPFYGKGVWLEHWYNADHDDSTTAAAQSSGDILQFALDMDNYKLWVGVNGQFKASNNNDVSYSDIAAGNNATVTISSAAYTNKTFFPSIWIRDDQDADDNVAEINFGNPSNSISSGNSDFAGIGNFEYVPPSGFFAICTKNLAQYG